jgi:NADH dehydrogenase
VRQSQVQVEEGRPRIVIVGGGFGGAYCAQALERRLRRDEADVVLLDRNNYFVFYPLLVEAGTGSLEPRHAVVSIRSFLRRTRFIMATVDRIDPESRSIRCTLPDGESTQFLEYDHLVLTPGSVTRMPELPGLAEYGFEMKSLADAVTMRDHAIRKLEQADGIDDPSPWHRMLHFIVVGANFTGVEVAGELQVFLRRATKHYPRLEPDDIKVTLLELGDRILPALDPELSRYAAEQLRRRGVRIEFGRSLQRVEAGLAVLDDGRVLESETVYWCAGIAPSPLLAQPELPTDERGYLLCERDLRVEGYSDLWGIGDCAVNLDDSGQPYPATAQLAVRQGQHAARNIAAVIRGREATACDLDNLGAIAALGCRTGVAKIFGIKIAGFAAWFLFRTVYLLKMPGWARRIRVALDWTIDMIFPKDVVQLGVTGGPRHPTIPAGLDGGTQADVTTDLAQSASPGVVRPSSSEESL